VNGRDGWRTCVRGDPWRYRRAACRASRWRLAACLARLLRAPALAAIFARRLLQNSLAAISNNGEIERICPHHVKEWNA